MDPVYRTNLLSQPWEVPSYSSVRKAFYGPVPYNTQSCPYAPVSGHFDYTRLRQTNPLDLIYSQSPASPMFGVVPLAHTLSPLLNKMGTIRDTQTGQSLGTCVLIAENLVLMARHAIEGRNVPYLDVTFGYTEFLGKTHSAGHTLFESVIENDPSLDYAIVKLKGPIGKRLGFVSLNTQDHTVSEPALLHYPLGKPLKVSVHAFDQTPYQTQFLLTYHDSDSFSSGGSYFDPYGRLSALHLGSQYDGKTLNLLRYALPLRKIVTHHPTSILHKFATRELSQSRSYTSQDALTYLPFTDHQFLMDEEGYQSEKVLRRLLGSRVQTDRNIRKTQRGAISFSPTNLQYIATTYPAIYRAFQKECLGVTGVHAWTKQFSVTGVIESDHTIPHDVWKSTTNPKMKKFVTGRGSRPGENTMPAITIPYDKHRPLRTTGSSPEATDFRRHLTALCNADRIDDALTLCFQEYAAHGINLRSYRRQITHSLSEHVKLGVITDAQKTKITKKLFPKT